MVDVKKVVKLVPDPHNTPQPCNTKGAWNSEKRYSRQLGFRLWAFSETQWAQKEPGLLDPGSFYTPQQVQIAHRAA